MNRRSVVSIVAQRRPQRALLLTCALLGVGCLFAGCGTASSAADAPTATTIPYTPGTTQLNGCPVQQAPSGTPAADTVVSQSSGAAAQPVTLQQGQTLEIRLPATFRWALVTDDAGNILQSPATNGWFDDNLKSCVWRFIALKAGQATLSFGGGQVCSSASKCPEVVLAQSLSVTVQ